MIETSAIVLRTLKIGDNKQIIDFLTSGGNRLSCVAAVGLSGRSRIRRHLFQPMTIMDISYDARPAASLQRLRDAHISVPYATLTSDVRKLSTLLFLSEFLYCATPSEHDNAGLYAYVVNSLQWLDGCAVAAPNFHLVFMMRIARFIGFFPNTGDYSAGDMFDLRQGCFVSAVPQHSDYLDVADSTKILTLMRMNYATMHLFRMSHVERNRIVSIILYYYRLHVPGFPEMKSLSVVKEIFGNEE